MSGVSVVQLAYGGMGAPVLRALTADERYQVVAIVTPPADSPLYRLDTLLPQERIAEEAGIEVIRTESLSVLHDSVERLAPEIVLIASFNRIIPERTLALSKFVNIHHGKLPRQRGRANINWSIINGETSVSVSVHEAIPELDAGDILRQYHLSIGPKDDVADVYARVNETLAAKLPDLLSDYLAGKVALQPQDQSAATYFCTRLPDDGMIDWSWPRARIRNFVRALRKPFPGAFTYFGDQKVTVWAVREPDLPRVFEGIVPGRVVGIHKGVGVEVLAGDGPLLITEAEGAGATGDLSQVVQSTKCTLGLTVPDLLRRLEAVAGKQDG